MAEDAVISINSPVSARETEGLADRLEEAATLGRGASWMGVQQDEVAVRSVQDGETVNVVAGGACCRPVQRRLAAD